MQGFSLNLELSPLFQNSKCIIFGRIGKKGKIQVAETTIKQSRHMTSNVAATEERILDHCDLPMLTKLPIGTWFFSPVQTSP